MEYLELTVDITPRDPWAEVLVAELAELGFESFVETETGIQAYAPAEIGDAESLFAATSVASHPELEIKVHSSLIPHQNWNALWEADFEPVLVEDKLVILAPFHDATPFADRRQIIIQPQMSFGTGHHQTTWMMCSYLLDMAPIEGKVLDMGTGTGVLAILAEQLGAKEILAVDIEPWSVENTEENARRNSCKHIETQTGDIDCVTGSGYHYILANINKNILKRHLPLYASLAQQGGQLLLSGFFVSDVPELVAAAKEAGFEHQQTQEKETWAALRFTKL